MKSYRKKSTGKKVALLLTMALLFLLLAAGCTEEIHEIADPQKPVTENETSVDDTQGEVVLSVSGDGLDGGPAEFTLAELQALPDGGFEHIYSVINNWPSPRFYAARGVSVESVLTAVGVWDSLQTVTFRSPDSYETTLTKSQLTAEQYYFPGVETGSPEGAEEVLPIIAYEYKEGSADMSEAVPDMLCLVIGQRNHLEHTNPAFVVGVSELIVSAAPAEQWEPAGTFPEAGKIAAGETVKLQHPSFGLVKMFYTLDGSEPTELSAMYNPSTYQPELNVPIPITEDVTIKVLVTGYGKEDSEIATFEFDAQ